MSEFSKFSQSHDFANAFARAYSRPSNTVDAQTLAFAALGLTDEQNQPFLSSIEMAHPLETILTNQFIRPLLESVLPEHLRAAPGFARAGEAQPDLAAELAELRKEMAAMREEMEKLRKRKK